MRENEPRPGQVPGPQMGEKSRSAESRQVGLCLREAFSSEATVWAELVKNTENKANTNAR